MRRSWRIAFASLFTLLGISSLGHAKPAGLPFQDEVLLPDCAAVAYSEAPMLVVDASVSSSPAANGQSRPAGVTGARNAETNRNSHRDAPPSALTTVVVVGRFALPDVGGEEEQSLPSDRPTRSEPPMLSGSPRLNPADFKRPGLAVDIIPLEGFRIEF